MSSAQCHAVGHCWREWAARSGAVRQQRRLVVKGTARPSAALRSTASRRSLSATATITRARISCTPKKRSCCRWRCQSDDAQAAMGRLPAAHTGWDLDGAWLGNAGTRGRRAKPYQHTSTWARSFIRNLSTWLSTRCTRALRVGYREIAARRDAARCFTIPARFEVLLSLRAPT